MNNPASLREQLYVIVFQTDTVAGRRFDKILLLIILASMAYLLRALSAGAPTTGRGLVVATAVGAAVQFLLARVLASRWLRAQAS